MALAESIMERWFSARFRKTDDLMLWRTLLTRQPDKGYMGCSAANFGK